MRSVIVGMLLVAACGGGDGPITADEARNACQMVCVREEACSPGGEGVEACTTECVDDFAGWARSDAFQDLASCAADQPCSGGDDDQCLAAVRPLDVHRDWENKCIAKLANEGCGISEAECDVDGNNESAIFRLIAEPIMEEIIDCTDKPDCATRLECIDAVFDHYGIDF